MRTDRKGRIERAAIALTGVNPVPFRAAGVEARLVGAELDAGTAASATRAIEELDPMEDIHASADYRCHLAGVFTRRALESAYQRARA